MGLKSEELTMSTCLPGYLPKADIARCSWHVANVPGADLHVEPDAEQAQQHAAWPEIAVSAA
jgi:hypothetical protein